MWSGNAAGDCMPPMVVYKAKHVYEGWTQGGPAGTVYRLTDSGWFDSETFATWFKDVFIESIEDKPGKHLLFGDNQPCVSFQH